MSILDLNADQMEAAAISVPVMPKPKPSPKFSIWGTMTAAPKGLAAAGAERTGFLADVLGAFGQVAGAYPEVLGAGVQLDATQRKQADEARTKLLTEGINFSSEPGDLFRNVARDYRPDAETGHAAEHVLFGLSRTLGKVVGDVATMGPAGAVVSGLDEASMVASDLAAQGVSLQQRTEAGLVQGGFMAAGAVLPLAGQTLKQTAALYFAGGPGSFMAGQALTRKILEADTPQVAAQFDPFDPVGLAVSTLLPLPFAHMGLRANRAAQADAFRAGPVPSEPTAVARGVAEAFTPTAEQVDAARVQLLVEQRRSASLADPGDMAGATRHADALARAEDQLAAGERVSVADVAPVSRVADESPTKVQQNAAMPETNAPGQSGDAQGATQGRTLTEDQEAAAPPADGFTRLYHGGGKKKDGGSFDEVPANGPFDGFFTHVDRGSSWGAHGDGSNYFADIEEGKVLTDYALNYEVPYEDTLAAFTKVTGISEGDDNFDAAWAAVIEDKGNASAEEAGLSDTILDDAGLVAQKMRGRVAKALGFQAVEMEDEHGTSWLVVPGTPLTRVIPNDQPAPVSGGAMINAAPEQPAPLKPSEAFTQTLQDGGNVLEALAATVDQIGAPAKAADSGKAPGAADPAAAADAQRLTAVAQQFPDLEVMLDGMDRPQRLSEFLASVKAEADAEIADAPLLKVAAECALLNGP